MHHCKCSKPHFFYKIVYNYRVVTYITTCTSNTILDCNLTAAGIF